MISNKLNNDYMLHQGVGYLQGLSIINVKTSLELKQFIKNNKTNQIKLRVFDNFLYEPLYMYNSSYHGMTGTHLYLTDKHNYNNKWHWESINVSKYDDKILYASFLTDADKYVDMPFFGLYAIGKCAVLCTLPDYRTLMKSYKDNRIKTYDKLSIFTNSNSHKRSIINSAKELIILNESKMI